MSWLGCHCFLKDCAHTPNPTEPSADKHIHIQSARLPKDSQSDLQCKCCNSQPGCRCVEWERSSTTDHRFIRSRLPARACNWYNTTQVCSTKHAHFHHRRSCTPQLTGCAFQNTPWQHPLFINIRVLCAHNPCYSLVQSGKGYCKQQLTDE